MYNRLDYLNQTSNNWLKSMAPEQFDKTHKMIGLIRDQIEEWFAFYK